MNRIFNLDKEFKDKVMKARERLNEMLVTGNIDEDLEREIDQLKKTEHEIFVGLIPHYRVADESKYGMKRTMVDLSRQGKYELEDFVHGIYRVGDGIFLVNTIDGQIRLATIDEVNEEIEYTVELKSVNGRINDIKKIKEDEYLIVLDTGKFINLTVETDKLRINTEEIYDLKKHIFKAIVLNEDYFIVEAEEGYFILKCAGKSTDLMDLNLGKISVTSWLRLKSNLILLSDQDGNVFSLRLDSGYELKKIFEFEDGPVIKMDFLQREKSELKDIGFLFDDGRLIIIDELDYKVKNDYKLDGKLFDISSSLGTGIILSEEGIMYVVDENLGKWRLNADLKERDISYFKTLALSGLSYLIIDIDNNFKILRLDRVNEPEDLWNRKLYG